jgi:hypothetical protein
VSLLRLSKDLSVVNPGSTTDDYGNVTPDWTTTPVTEKGLIQETQSTEVTVGRDTVVTNLLALLPVNSAVTSYSRIVKGTPTLPIDWSATPYYEVVGVPTVYDTGSPGVRHCECHLNTSQG